MTLRVILIPLPSKIKVEDVILSNRLDDSLVSLVAIPIFIYF